LQFIWLPCANATTIDAFVDRSAIRENESFTLTFEADGSVDDAPDFSPIETYFDIVNQGKSSNMSIINGSVSHTTSWKLALMPRKTGHFIIPAISFGQDKSKPLTINVLPASAPSTKQDSDLFMETEVSSNTGYVQAQLIYTIRLYRAVDISSGSLSEPKLSDADAVVIKLGEDKTYQTTRNNRRLVVTERRYAVFPQQSGQLTIEPIEFTGQIAAQQRSLFNFDPMPFSSGRTERLFSKKIKLNIQPIPDSFKQGQWLPAAQLYLSDEWPDNRKFKVGDPVTRTIILKVQGLTSSQLPQIKQPEIEGLKQYPDQPVLKDNQQSSGITGTIKEKIAIIPTQAGTFQLPEINIPWWNTQTNERELATIPARTIHVIAGAAAQSAPTQPQPTATDNPSGDQAAQQTLNKSNITQSAPPQTPYVWIIISGFLALGWIATLAIWYLRSRSNKTENSEPADENLKTLKQARHQLKAAIDKADKNDAKQALLEWARAYWPARTITNIGQIEALVSPQLQIHIQNLNKVLYDAKSPTWQAASLYDELVAFEKQNAENTKSVKDHLPPIYKIQER
jgi:hypothetical protein